MIARAVTRTVAAVAVAGLAAACGAAESTKSGSRQPVPVTLRWFLTTSGPPNHTGGFAPVFHGRKPFLPGDGFTAFDSLPGGGHEDQYCVVAGQQPRSTFWCRRTFVLPKGQIVVAGEYDDAAEGNNPGTIPVVGGTGAYAGARGTLTSAGGARRGLTLTIRLR